MRVRRERSTARSPRPLNRARRPATARSLSFGTSVVLVASLAVAEGAAAVRAPSTSAIGSSPLHRAAAALHSGSHGVVPVVHEISVPTVAPADRAATAAATGSRAALTTTQARGSAALPLVAHAQSPVRGGFSMLGVTWRRTPTTKVATPVVTVRTKPAGPGSTWSRWTELHVDPAEGPAVAEDAAVRDGTEPMFVGDAVAVEVDVYAANGVAPTGLSVAAIDPGTGPTDGFITRSGSIRTGASTSGTTTGTDSTAPTRDGYPELPRVVTRRGWGADESLGDPCWSPRYGRTFKAVFVHHTAGSNNYTRRESPGIVRGIYAYHTQSRHWCDIGYNFLVDKYGTVYEGRAGGIRKAVRGAHAGDYNVNSTGISLMGEFTKTTPTTKMRHALIRLVAWRLGVAYHGGYGHVRLNGKEFARISGHRDAMSTACPGQQVYDWLPVLRRKVNERLDGFSSRIKRWYQDNGGRNSSLGVVRIGEVKADSGRHTTFTGGRMYFKNSRLRKIMNGPFLRAYVALGEVNGRLGYPVSRVREARKGEWADFEDAALFWSPATGRNTIVPGHILRKYRRLDGPGGRLGFPETGVKPAPYGSYTRFHNGVIRFDQDTKRTTVTYE